MRLEMTRYNGVVEQQPAEWYGWTQDGQLPAQLAFVRARCGCELRTGQLFRCVSHGTVVSHRLLATDLY